MRIREVSPSLKKKNPNHAELTLNVIQANSQNREILFPILTLFRICLA